MRTSLSFAAERIELLVRLYGKSAIRNPVQIAGMVEVLACYETETAVACTSPTGVARQSVYLPNIAEIAVWCDAYEAEAARTYEAKAARAEVELTRMLYLAPPAREDDETRARAVSEWEGMLRDVVKASKPENERLRDRTEDGPPLAGDAPLAGVAPPPSPVTPEARLEELRVFNTTHPIVIGHGLQKILDQMRADYAEGGGAADGAR